MLLEKLSHIDNIIRAFDNAAQDRHSCEHAMFLSELNNAKDNKQEFIRRISAELQCLDSYKPAMGFYYAVPKSSLVDRYLVFLPFKELVLRYCFIQIIADIIDPQLIAHCFANRIDNSDKHQGLTKNFAENAWPNYCQWQQESANKHSVMIITDLSGYFDNIEHDRLIETLAQKMGYDASDAFFSFFKTILATPVIQFSHDDSAKQRIHYRNRGILTGPTCDSVLANFYLMDIDREIASNPNIEYGRYVDDIKIFGDNKNEVMLAFRTIQQAFYDKGLNINAAKTQLINEQQEIVEVVIQGIMSTSHYGDEATPESKTLKKVFDAGSLKIDTPFTERIAEFDDKKGIQTPIDAKNFCFYLNRLECEEWKMKHLAYLMLILKRYPSSSKFAAWLIVKGLMQAKDDIQYSAFDFIANQLLQSSDIHAYVKSRVLHHLNNTRKQQQPYLVQWLDDFKESDFVKGISKVLKTSNCTLLTLYSLDSLYLLTGGYSLNQIRENFASAGISLNPYTANALAEISD